MPLSAELDRKIKLRFDELVEEAERLLENFNEDDEEQFRIYEAWCVKASGLVPMLYGNSSEGKKFQKLFEERWTIGDSFEGFGREAVLVKLSGLQGLKSNYEGGFLERLHDQLIANVSADYMEQAETLLSEGFHVPAAALCGAVLEDALRRLCAKQTPPIETTKSNGDKKTLEPLIQDLQKAKIFNKLVADQLRAWTKNRNYAAHGEFDEFRPEDVDLMLSGVRHFLAAHL